MTFVHLWKKGVPGQTTIIYLLVEGKVPLLCKLCWYWAFHWFSNQIWVQTKHAGACETCSLYLQAPYLGSHSSTAKWHPDIHTHTHTSTYTSVEKLTCWQLKPCTRVMTMREKHWLWKNTNLENAYKWIFSKPNANRRQESWGKALNELLKSLFFTELLSSQ